MINRFMISVAALALLAGTGFANAQGVSDKGGFAGSQSTQQNAQPSGGAAERGGSMGRQDSMGKQDRQDKGTVGQSGSMKSGQSTEDRSSGGMKKNESAEDKAGTRKGSRDERAQDQDQKSKSMSSETETRRSKDMKAEGRDSGKADSRERGKTTESREGRTDQMRQGQREGQREGQAGTSTQTTGQAGAGAKLSTEQRTQITSVIREQHVSPVTNVNFAIAVGTRIPRQGIELHALPSRVVSIYPEWRSYKYIVVREEIVIIDPNTYEIVAVLNV